jgi:hypothetical protein
MLDYLDAKIVGLTERNSRLGRYNMLQFNQKIKIPFFNVTVCVRAALERPAGQRVSHDPSLRAGGASNQVNSCSGAYGSLVNRG